MSANRQVNNPAMGNGAVHRIGGKSRGFYEVGRYTLSFARKHNGYTASEKGGSRS